MFKNFMNEALKEAKKALAINEVPVGAVIVKDNKVITSAYNTVELDKKTSSHAEIKAINKACEILETKFLNDCDIYVTLEPCPMCAFAISMAKIRRLYFGTKDDKNGCVVSKIKIFNNNLSMHKPEIYQGILELECATLLKDFFKTLR
jgi:tRNA(adenine34) deaminase